MTLYARRDYLYVSEPGGCGAPHSRPVTHGSPVQLWELNCPPCEKILVNDPGWSITRSDIPETPDEKAERESVEKRGIRDRDTLIAASLAKLAGLAESDPAPEALKCQRGHANLPSSRYCGECGISLSEDLVQAEIQHPSPPVPSLGPIAPITPSPAPPSTDSLMGLTVAELRKMAEDRGVDPNQPKRALREALAGGKS